MLAHYLQEVFMCKKSLCQRMPIFCYVRNRCFYLRTLAIACKKGGGQPLIRWNMPRNSCFVLNVSGSCHRHYQTAGATVQLCTSIILTIIHSCPCVIDWPFWISDMQWMTMALNVSFFWGFFKVSVTVVRKNHSRDEFSIVADILVQNCLDHILDASIVAPVSGWREKHITLLPTVLVGSLTLHRHI